MAKKVARTSEEATQDSACISLLDHACMIDAETAFARADAMKPCNVGSAGLCCKNCSMGPCRLVGKAERGVCGATIATIAARNFARAVAAGASAHSDHGRGLAYTLLEASEGRAPDYGVRDRFKFLEIAQYLDVETAGRETNDIARDVALASLHEFGRIEGVLHNLKRAPKKRQEIWHEQGVEPRAIDREVVETLHRTHVGNDQDAEHILDQAMRCALGDGWGQRDPRNRDFGAVIPYIVRRCTGAGQKRFISLFEGYEGEQPLIQSAQRLAVPDKTKDTTVALQVNTRLGTDYIISSLDSAPVTIETPDGPIETDARSAVLSVGDGRVVSCSITEGKTITFKGQDVTCR